MHVCCTNFFFYLLHTPYMSHPHKHVQSNNSRQKYIYEKTKTKKRGRQTNLNTFLSVHTIKYLKLAISEWFECNHLITIFWFEMWGTSACPFHVHILLLVVWAKKPNNCGPYIKLSLSLLSLGLVGEYDNSLVLSQSYSFGL